MIPRLLALVCTLLLLAACTVLPPRQVEPPRAPVLLISIDGFRADYLDRGLTPTLKALAEAGVRAEFMRLVSIADVSQPLRADHRPAP